MFKKEEKNGKILLAPRSGLFIVNTVDDIRIELNALEPGWEIKESNVKVKTFVLLSYDTKSGRLNTNIILVCQPYLKYTRWSGELTLL